MNKYYYMHIGDKGKEEWSSNAAIWRYGKICAGISSRIKIGVDLTRRPGAEDNIRDIRSTSPNAE